MISFFVPGPPIAQPRARAAVIDGRAHIYNPTSKKTKNGRASNGVAEYKQAVRLLAAAAWGRPPTLRPVRVNLLLVFPRPAKMKPGPRVWHTKKPDRDNCDKAVLDSLKGLVWRDDCQACDGRITKVIGATGERIGVYVSIKVL